MPPPASHIVIRLRVMVAAQAAAEGGVRLDHRRAAELAAPDDQRVVEQAALLQVLRRARRLPGRSRRSCFLRLPATSRVGVPAFVVDVDEAHAALDHPPGQQAGPGERRLGRVAAVQVERLLRSRCCRSISSGADGLQAEGHLVGGDARGDLRVADRRQPLAVQRADQVERVALQLRRRCPAGLETLRIGSPWLRSRTPV